MNWIEKIIITLIAHLHLIMDIKPTFALSQNLIKRGHHSEGENNSSDTIEKYIAMLSSLLMDPWPPGMSPLVYIENGIDQFLRRQEAQLFTETYKSSGNKRSKYYRRYPLKRQNLYSRYEAENRYMCLPSKKEVIKLLIALRESKQGKRGNTVSFCHRRRPVRTVFTNIRFLG